MKFAKVLFGLLTLLFVGNVNAADITLYYSPTCPHCHHARQFIADELIYVYDDLNVTTINVMEAENRQKFFDTVKECEFKSGGVPVLVIGGKCFQGYSAAMQKDYRAAIESDYSDDQKKAAEKNKSEFDNNHDAFVASRSERTKAISEFVVKKKVNNGVLNTTNLLFAGIILLLIGGLVLLFKKQK